jgi:hypothetical protein
MEYIATGLYFFEIAILEGLFPLHASAISFRSEAILFSAPSGVGKSTQGNLWKQKDNQVKFINDDKPLLSIKDNVLVYGSPWCGKTYRNENVALPLRAIFFIEQGKTNQIFVLNNQEKIIQILKNTHRSLQEQNQQTMLSNVECLINKANICRFCCTNTMEAYDVAFQYLYGEHYGA